MRIITIAIITATCLFSQDLFRQGVEEYNKRSIGAEGLFASSIHIDKAINLFGKELDNISKKRKELDNASIHLELKKQTALFLLKSYYFKGEYVIKDSESKKIIFDKGKELAEKYIDIYPESAAIRYWYLVNLGSWAEVYGILKAAREGVADIMKEQSEKIIDLDPSYKNGGGHFMLGAVHLKSPYIPFLLSWPDKDEAVEYLMAAKATGEATLVQKKYLAHAFYKIGKKKIAIRLLNEVINSEPSEDERIEDLNDINKAKELLKTF